MSYVDEEMMAKGDDRGVRSGVGVSLGSDAWRRLRRDRIAMLSLATLVSISVLAFFTPMLPLQPPDRDVTRLQYQPPQVSPLFEKSFNIDWAAIERTPEDLQKVRGDLAAATGAIVTVEEALVRGGLGGAVAEYTAGHHPVPVERLGFQGFQPTGSLEYLFGINGLTVEGISAAALKALKRSWR